MDTLVLCFIWTLWVELLDKDLLVSSGFNIVQSNGYVLLIIQLCPDIYVLLSIEILGRER